jgi:hypothetical protein
MRLISIHVLVASLLLVGCSFPGVHKNPVKQGNQLIPERVERLEAGMTRDQVQFCWARRLLSIPSIPIAGSTLNGLISTVKCNKTPISL